MKKSLESFKLFPSSPRPREEAEEALQDAYKLDSHYPQVQGAGFRVQGSGCRVQGTGFRAEGSGFRVQIGGFGVRGLP